MGIAARAARMLRIVEARKKVIKLRRLVPPDGDESVQFASIPIGVDLVDQRRTSGRQVRMYHTMTRTAVGKELAALHRLGRVPVACQGLRQSLNLRIGGRLGGSDL